MLYVSRAPGVPHGIGWWTLSTGLNVLRYVAIYWALSTQNVHAVFIVEVLHIVSSIFLAVGAAVFLGLNISKKIVGGVVFVAMGWAAYTTWVVPDFWLRSIPLYLLAGSAALAVGIVFILKRRSPLSREFVFIGILFILWGLHKFDYPFLRQVEWFAPYGFLVGMVLFMAIAFTLIMIVLKHTMETIKNEIKRRESAERDAQNALKEAQEATQSKSEFMATVSHELRTPLTSIKGVTGALASGQVFDLPEQVQKMLVMADNNTDRLTRLVNDILDVERILADRMAFEFERLDLSHAVHMSLTDNAGLAENYEVRFQESFNANTPIFVQGDHDRLAQIFANLLSNAAKFSKPGDLINVSILQMENAVQVHVTDYGPGVGPEHHETIFDRFSRLDSRDNRSKSGTGLGLYISHSIAERHGGH